MAWLSSGDVALPLRVDNHRRSQVRFLGNRTGLAEAASILSPVVQCHESPSAASTTFSVVRLLRVGMAFHRSAWRHGVGQDGISHAFEHALAWIELGDDPPRYLVAGPDRAGNLLELVVIEIQQVLVIHAMALRSSARRELFGTES